MSDGYPWNAKITGASVVKIASNARSLSPCGWCDGSCRRMRSTTFTTRTRRSGRRSRSSCAAATVSMVGTSPAQAMTTSGTDAAGSAASYPGSLPAAAHTPMPASTWAAASIGVSHCGCGCLPATITFTRFCVSKTCRMTSSSVFASGGR